MMISSEREEQHLYCMMVRGSSRGFANRLTRSATRSCTVRESPLGTVGYSERARWARSAIGGRSVGTLQVRLHCPAREPAGVEGRGTTPGLEEARGSCTARATPLGTVLPRSAAGAAAPSTTMRASQELQRKPRQHLLRSPPQPRRFLLRAAPAALYIPGSEATQRGRSIQGQRELPRLSTDAHSLISFLTLEP